MKFTYYKLVIVFFGIISISFIIRNKTNKIYKRSSSWISLEYLNCLKNRLPCECEKISGDFFLLKFEIPDQQEHLLKLLYYGHDEMEFSTFWVNKKATKYEILNYQDTTIKIGEFIIKDTIMYFTNRKGLIKSFVNLPLKNGSDDENIYNYENYRILNNSIRKKNPSLNTILHKENLKCYCNKWLNGVNILSNDTVNWILEKSKDNLIIYEKMDTSDVMSQPPAYFKTNKKTIKW